MFQSETRADGVKVFLPNEMDVSEYVDVTKVGEEFATLYNPRTQHVINCKEHYDTYRNLLQTAF